MLATAKAKPAAEYASAGQARPHLNAESSRWRRNQATTYRSRVAEEVTEGCPPGRLLLLADRAASANPRLLQALAVGSPRRASALPDVPTTAEAGVPGSEFNFWIGMMVPAKTPRAIVNRLNAEVLKALALPEVRERFVQLGADVWTLSPEQFDAYLKTEIVSNAALVKAAGLSPAN